MTVISARKVLQDLGYNSPAFGLRAVCQEQQVPSLRALALKALAVRYNSPPYPLGLPINAGGDAVGNPVVTRDPVGRFMVQFRGGLIRDPSQEGVN